MRSTTIKKFKAMRDALVKERSGLEARLVDINEALGVPSEPAPASAAVAPASAPAKKSGKRRGRPPGKKKAAKKKAGRPAKAAAPAKTAKPAKAAKPAKKAGRKKGAGRGKNANSLKATVLKVLGKKGLKRQKIVAAVKAAGYIFATKNPLNSVSAMLYSDKKTFKKKDGKFVAA